MNIHYLRNHEIDIKAWDKCIARSFNGSISAYSWVLDIICENWDALVEDQYESVMPLPKQRIFGKEVVYMPCFANDLGIFSFNPVNPAKTRAYIDALSQHFDYYRIVLNKYNPLYHPDFKPVTHVGYELDMIKPYFKLTTDFVPDLQRKLNIAMARGFSFAGGLLPNDLINFIVERKIRVPREVVKYEYRLLRSVISGLISNKAGKLYAVYDPFNELAAVLLVTWINTRINLTFQVVAPDRVQDDPQLFLIDRIIDQYAETNSTLHFGPVIPPYASSIYMDFGARKTYCLEIYRNNLPFPYNRLINYRILNTFLSSVHSSNN